MRHYTLRSLLLGLVLLGTVGLLVELALLEHYASFWQAFPLGVLGLGLGTALVTAYRPGLTTLRVFRLTMGVLVVTGALGVWLHYDENAVFEREINPAITGTALIWKALRGATPILAPGAMVQLGLLGLILVHEHAALRRPVPREAANT